MEAPAPQGWQVLPKGGNSLDAINGLAGLPLHSFVVFE